MVAFSDENLKVRYSVLLKESTASLGCQKHR